MDSKNAPFTTSRVQLYHLLQKYTFAKVIQRPIFPSDQRKNSFQTSSSPYYHFKAVKLQRGETTNPDNSLVWCTSSTKSLRPFDLGCIQIFESNSTPEIGDVIMGIAVPNMTKKSNENGKKSRVGEKFVQWFSNANALYCLFDIVLNGTSKTENQVAYNLRTPTSVGLDGLWAIFRLVILGHVNIFDIRVDRDASSYLQLDCPLDTFVSKVSYMLNDESIWKTYVNVTKYSLPRPSVTSPRNQQQYQTWEQPPNLTSVSNFGNSNVSYLGNASTYHNTPYSPAPAPPLQYTGVNMHYPTQHVEHTYSTPVSMEQGSLVHKFDKHQNGAALQHPEKSDPYTYTTYQESSDEDILYDSDSSGFHPSE